MNKESDRDRYSMPLTSRRLSKNISVNDVRFLFLYQGYYYGYLVPDYQKTRIFYYRAKSTSGEQLSHLKRISARDFIRVFDNYMMNE